MADNWISVQHHLWDHFSDFNDKYITDSIQMEYFNARHVIKTCKFVWTPLCAAFYSFWHVYIKFWCVGKGVEPTLRSEYYSNRIYCSFLLKIWLHINVCPYSEHDKLWRMPSSGMLCRVALVRNDVLEEHSISIIRVAWICQLLVTANVVSSSPIVTLMVEVLHSSETSVLTRATWPNIPGDGILHSHHCESLKSYMINSDNVSENIHFGRKVRHQKVWLRK
jgi:hypothetical protein